MSLAPDGRERLPPDIHTTRNCLLYFTPSSGSYILLHKHPSVLVLFYFQAVLNHVRLIFKVKLEQFARASVITTVQVYFIYLRFS